MDLDELRDWLSEKSDHYFDWFLFPEEYEEFLEEHEIEDLEDDED